MNRYLTTANIAWLVAYALLMGLVVGLLFYWRSQALANFAAPQTQAEWDTFRTQMKKVADDPASSVDRQPPRSAEKPDLRLARDYFGVCVFMAVLITSLLYATFVFMVRGVFGGEKFTPRGE